MKAESIQDHGNALAVLQCDSVWSLEFPGCPELVFGFTGSGPGSKRRLALLLFDAFGKRQITAPGRPNDALIRLEADSLGRPNLRVRNRKGPPISFSRAENRLWGAVGAGRGIGIDAASPREFVSPYPYTRVFHRRELVRISRLCDEGLPAICALLWSVKEATVKALGCGFHMLDPLDIEVHDPVPCKGGLLFTVHVGYRMPVWSKRENMNWLSVAVHS